MNDDNRNNIYDKNLAEMFSMSRDSVRPEFENRLIQVVGQEVRQQRRRRSYKRWFGGIAAAAAIAIVATLSTRPTSSPREEGPVGTIAQVQGLVLVTNGHGPEVVEGQRDIQAQQWIQTCSGTTAQVTLSDQSQLTPQPRTVMQLDRQKQGNVVRIEEGAVAIAANKQLPKKHLAVETPGTTIKILGTQLDVRVIERPSSTKQTRIHLHSGSIEVTSAGVSARLLPGMVAVTEEGREPEIQSSVLEVNELRRLWSQAQQRAKRTNAQANMPMIVDYVNSTVWAMIPLERFIAEPEGVFSLQLKYPAFGVKAYTQEGALAQTSASGRTLYVNLSQRPREADTVTHVILRVPRATGLFRINNDRHELALPAASSSVTLLQLCLPESAKVQAVSGEIIETSERLDRLVVTLAADSEALEIYE